MYGSIEDEHYIFIIKCIMMLSIFSWWLLYLHCYDYHVIVCYVMNEYVLWTILDVIMEIIIIEYILTPSLFPIMLYIQIYADNSQVAHEEWYRV